MFIDPAWQEGLIALLLAINGTFGAADLTAVLHAFSPRDVVVISQSLERRNYRPAQWFGVAAAISLVRPPLESAAPVLRLAQRYTVVRFDAEPSDRTQVSSRSGGLLFEDPFYAVLAAFNAGAASLAIEVKASSRDQAWARRQSIIDAIRLGQYRADRYFAERGPLLSGTLTGNWSVAEISGTDLDRLIFNGRAGASLDHAPALLHGLYKYVAP